MQVISNRKEKIFRKDLSNGNTIYTIGLSKKDRNGKYINGYMLCNFKKDANIPDKSFIYIKSAWLDFYLKDSQTIPFIFINEYELIDETQKETQVLEVESITAEQLDDPELPF